MKIIAAIVAGLIFLVAAGALLAGTGVVTGACTGWFDGYWQSCCAAHDVAYGAGVSKIAADLDLAHCVAMTGHAGIGLLMLAGVTVFGWFFYKRR